jgi:hypothetical protein
MYPWGEGQGEGQHFERRKTAKHAKIAKKAKHLPRKREGREKYGSSDVAHVRRAPKRQIQHSAFIICLPAFVFFAPFALSR